MINPSIVEKFIDHVKQIALIEFGRPFAELSDYQKFNCLSIAVKEEVMIRLFATQRSQSAVKAKKIYYISLEYLPGRQSLMNVLNLLMDEEVEFAAKKLGLNLWDYELFGTDPGLGNGGLGRLASCYLESIATLGYPCIAYGLLYEYGIFKQDIVYGTQIERPEPWLEAKPPWFYTKEESNIRVQYYGEAKVQPSTPLSIDLIHAETIEAQCIETPIVGYGTNGTVLPLRLFTTRSASNNFRIQSFSSGDLQSATLFTLVTSVLYPSDAVLVGREFRLMQEYLLVAGAIQDLLKDFFLDNQDIRLLGEKVQIQLNDTHPSLACAELFYLLVTEYALSTDEAWKVTSSVLNYTNHTILQEALEKWDVETFKRILPRQYKVIEWINQHFCDQLRAQHPENEALVRRVSIIEQGKIHMAHLCLVLCSHVNGVARLHSELLKELLFKDFYFLYPEKFKSITNGVTFRRWVYKCNRPLALLITELTSSSDWITNYKNLENLKIFAEDRDTQQRLLSIKQEAKQGLLEYLQKRQEEKEGNRETLFLEFFKDTEPLYDVQIKRMHEYKRQLMNALRLIMLRQEIKSGRYLPPIQRQVIFAGKAAPSYRLMKDTIRLIAAIGRWINLDPEVSRYVRVCFIANYTVSLAEKLIPAADLSEQISTSTFEASGTSCMKFALNGALTIGTYDGATIEMAEQIGPEGFPFLFGLQKEELLAKIHTYHPKEILEKDLAIREAVDLLLSDDLAQHPVEKEAFASLHHYLTTHDPYLTLADLRSYVETQKKVDQLYLDKNRWAKLCLMNIAGSGYFSSDRSVEEYAKEIWKIEKVPIDRRIISEIRKVFRQNEE